MTKRVLIFGPGFTSSVDAKFRPGPEVYPYMADDVAAAYIAAGQGEELSLNPADVGALAGVTSLAGVAAGAPLTNILSMNGGPLAGLRNALINGAADIWQRATSFTTSGYTADRWYAALSAASGRTISRQSGIGAGSKYALRLARDSGNAATTPIYGIQVIETAIARAMAGKTVTLSVLAQAGANFSGASSQITLAVFTGSGEDQGVASMLAGTWTGAASQSALKTISTSAGVVSASFAIPSGTKEIAVAVAHTPTGTAGAADYVDVGELQLEIGGVATPFEVRPQAVELALAERYYEKSYALGVAPGAAGVSGAFRFRASSTSHIHVLQYRTRKRATPTVVFYNPNTGGSGTWRDVSDGVNKTVAIGLSTETGGSVDITSSVVGNGVDGHWTADAEL